MVSLRTRLPETAAVMACGLLLLSLVSRGFCVDQAVFATVADVMLHGGVAYRDAWEHKPPGILILYYASFLLFGRSAWSPRILEIAALAAAGAGLVHWARRGFGRPWLGVAAALAMCALYLQFGANTAEPESFQIPFTVWALALWPRRGEAAPRPLRLVVPGLLLSVTLILKVTFATLPFLLMLDRLDQDRRRPGWKEKLAPTACFLAGLAVAPLLVSTYYALQGAFLAMLDAWILFPWRYASIKAGLPLAEFLRRSFEWPFLMLSIPAGAALLLGAAKAFRANRSEAWLWLAAFAASWAQIVVQGKFWFYHYIYLIPYLGLGMGMTLLDVPSGDGLGAARVRRALMVGGAILFVLGLRPLLGGAADAWKVVTRPPGFEIRESGEWVSHQQEVVEFIRATTRPADRIFIWGEDPIINYLSDRRIAGPYFHLIQIMPPWPSEERLQRQIESMLKRRPALVVLSLKHSWWRKESFAELLEAAPDFRRFLRDYYRQVRRIGPYELWALLPD